MGEIAFAVDYREWDWLPEAAAEGEAYLDRLLTEAAIKAHSVAARAKSITSFQAKCRRKDYSDPVREVTDTVAVRIITYSITDQHRAIELIRDRFQILEDRKPGEAKDQERRRGYDCHHFVITGESPDVENKWLIARGELSRYFEKFGGLEIQVRTVAAHAWAEFEHARRYKGQQYQAISEHDQETIDQLFGAASDARRALDETFRAIDRVLANPTLSKTGESELEHAAHDDISGESVVQGNSGEERTPIDIATLRAYLADRFPEDGEATDAGIQFACELLHACDLESIEALSLALEAIDGDQVRRLMDATISVTRVRRLDDELLARLGESYIRATGDIGIVRKRKQQLEWRYDRLRAKVGYSTYQISGADCPNRLECVLLPAARAVREVVGVLAERIGSHAVLIAETVGESIDALPSSARPKEVHLPNGQSLWVATNLRRDSSEGLLAELLLRGDELDLRVNSNGREVAATPA
ncbi:hypothetical protein GCM10027403_08770 [Arthrobacter tecti]